MFDKKRKRFCVKEEENTDFGIIRIVVDSQTGVNYILCSGLGGSSMTPLLDAEGNVVIDA